MHVFKYSRRKGTKADLMEKQISPSVQNKRSKALLELSNKNQKRYNDKYIGKVVEVLIEENQGEYIKGHSQNYLLVNIKEKTNKYNNEIVSVKITGILGEELIGIIM